MSPRNRLLIGLAAVLAAATAVAVVIRRDDVGVSPTSPQPIRLEIGGRPLDIPANAIRFSDQRVPGTRTRVDLALSWPELDGRSDTTAPRFDTSDQAADIVYLTLQPRHDTWDSATRLTAVYARFFVGEPWAGPGGLQGRRMSPKSGHADEEIYLEPGAVRPFVARCFPLAPGEPSRMCLRDVVHGNLLVTWRFPTALLGAWRDLDAGLDARLAGWGVEVR